MVFAPILRTITSNKITTYFILQGAHHADPKRRLTEPATFDAGRGYIKNINNISMTEQERQEKGAAFLAEYKELVDKHQMDFATYPMFIPDGQKGFKIVVQSTPVDISEQPKQSPFVATE